jgi:glyoxylase-like metal-dependent hydrolase (beta-lactamase superfamily II)
MEIVPSIHQVDGVSANCYVLERDGLTLIDTGLPGSGPRILSYIRDTLHRDPAEITTIVLTHHHVDHTGGIAGIQKAGRAKVAIHQNDAPYLEGAKTAPGPRGLFGLVFRFMRLFVRAAPVRTDILLGEGATIAGLSVFHIPGHTPGSIALLDPESGALFAGDTLRSNGTSVEGPVPQFTPDMLTALRSIRRLAALEFEILLPGHGVPLKGGAAQKVRAFVAATGG